MSLMDHFVGNRPEPFKIAGKPFHNFAGYVECITNGCPQPVTEPAHTNQKCSMLVQFLVKSQLMNGTVSISLIRISIHDGWADSLCPIVSDTDCFDGIQYRVPVATGGSDQNQRD